MSISQSRSRGLSLERAKSGARHYGIVSAILLVVALVVPNVGIQAFAIVGLAVTGWQFLFHGSTFVSMKLDGRRRQQFQILVVSVFPLVLSLYFIRDVSTLSFYGLFGYMFSWWFLIPITIIGYGSWVGADQLDEVHPFRGFLITSMLLFIICLMGHLGILSEADDYTEESYFFQDLEAAKETAQTGRYFGQYFIYVLVSYTAMLVKRYRRTPNIPFNRTR